MWLLLIPHKSDVFISKTWSKASAIFGARDCNCDCSSEIQTLAASDTSGPMNIDLGLMLYSHVLRRLQLLRNIPGGPKK